MPKPSKSTSALVLAAAALDDELRGYDDLSNEAKRVHIHSAKSLERAVRLVQESNARNEVLQEKVRELVAQIEAARLRQVESLGTLLEAAKHVQARTMEYEALLARFAAMGASAHEANTLAAELEAKRRDGAAEGEFAEGVAKVEESLARVVAEAEALAAVAGEQGWEDLARQADGARQQVLVAKNKLTGARRNGAARAP